MSGGGANLLINDQKVFPNVCNLREFNAKVECKENGRYYVGASVRLQKLIGQINNDGYGGIEYLFSVPGLVGGAVAMNAGRGKKYNQSISDYIETVEYIQNGQIYCLQKQNCQFAYRTSVFQSMPGCVITGVNFKFEPVEKAESTRRIQERLELCKQRQDNSAPNFGTVFCEANHSIMRLARCLALGNKRGVHYSAKTENWMLKGPEGTYKQALRLLGIVGTLHKVFGKKCRREVKLWD